jgi:hypothetical protein
VGCTRDEEIWGGGHGDGVAMMGGMSDHYGSDGRGACGVDARGRGVWVRSVGACRVRSIGGGWAGPLGPGDE